MKETTLFVLCGLPASGKTTWANYVVANNPDTVIVSSNDIRKELLGDETNQEYQGKIFDVVHDRIKEAIRDGKNVIVDATGINRYERRQSLHAGEDATTKICVQFETPMDICKERNANRERVVPDFVFTKMSRKFVQPSNYEGFDFIFHMDGAQMKPTALQV